MTYEETRGFTVQQLRLMNVQQATMKDPASLFAADMQKAGVFLNWCGLVRNFYPDDVSDKDIQMMSLLAGVEDFNEADWYAESAKYQQARHH